MRGKIFCEAYRYKPKNEDDKKTFFLQIDEHMDHVIHYGEKVDNMPTWVQEADKKTKHITEAFGTGIL